MTEAVSAKPKTSRKGSGKPKAPRQHPPYGVMIKKAIAALKDRKGSSRQALIKYIRGNFKIGLKENVDLYVRMALRAGVRSGKLVQSKGAGASGSFKLPEKSKNPGEKKVKKVGAAKKKTTPKKKAGPAKKKPSPKKKTTKKPKKADAPAAASVDAPAPAATPSKPKAKKTPKKPKSAAKKPIKRLGSAKKAGGAKKKAGAKKPKAKK